MAFDFPSSPAEGQIFNAPGGPSYVFNTPVWKAVGQGQIAIISDTPPASPANGALWYESDSGVLYIWYNDGNSSQWVQVGGVVASGSTFLQQQFITASGAITLHVATKTFLVELQGGGGNGNASNATTSATGAAGGGGGGGAYCSRWIIRPSGVYTPTCTVGAGGAAGSGTVNPGGASTFTDGSITMTAGGGQGGGVGISSPNSYIVRGGVGGSATGGTINAPGDDGENAWILGSNVQVGLSTAMGGHGGKSRYGAGGYGGFCSGGASSEIGYPPVGYGAGGGGSANVSGGAPQQGVDGAPGCVVITEYR